MSKPLVSIIITCYNYARYVSQSVESVLNQTYDFIELIVVNDGSTDNSKETIQQYLHNPKLVYVEQENTGLAIARNNGIKISKGEILLCLDADDYISPDYVENIVKNLTDYKTIVTTDIYMTDEFLNLTGSVINLNPTTYSNLLKDNQICVCSGFTKRLFEEVGGYDAQLSRMGYEDWDLWIRMFKAGAKATVINRADTNNPYFRYRRHGNSMLPNSIKIHDKIMTYLNAKYSTENFCMSPTYKTNVEIYFDDTSLKDEWQNEVYEYAKQVVKDNNYRTILDFGCGSGFKLMKYFSEFDTIGIDLPATVETLNKRYPNKVWKDELEAIECDVFIASDVIEHMTNPNILLDFIEKCNPKEVILSTPDRELFSGVSKNGPPQNIHHIREWSFKEFENYIGSRFKTIKHTITNREQCTQMMHVRLRERNAPIKEVANIFWHGELTKLEKVCIESFVKQGFETKIWSYTGIEVDGAKSCDARLVLPEESLTKYKQRHFKVTDGSKEAYSNIAAFSDAFRWNVINKFGGWWFDADCFCLKSADEFAKLRENKPLVACIQDHTCPSINSGAFYANYDVSSKLVERLNTLCAVNGGEFDNWGAIGPLLISDVVQDNDLLHCVISTENFYSIEHDQFDLFVNPEHKNLSKTYIKNSYVSHIWYSQLGLNNIDKNNPPIGSLLEEFYNGTYVNNAVENVEIISNYKTSLDRFINISRLYKKILKRSGDVPGIGGYVMSKLPYDVIENMLYNSDEYKFKNKRKKNVAELVERKLKFRN